MDMKKTAFILVFGLCVGHSGFSFAKDDMMDNQMCGQMCGMMGSQEGGQMCGMMGSQEGGQMGGMMGGHDSGAMMKIPRIGMVMALDLSDEQRSKINKLSDELRHKNWPTRGLIMDESAKLRDLYGADKRDPSAIGKEYQKIFDLERQMIEAMIDTQNRIEELLTPEQRAQLKDTHHKMEPKCCCKDKMENGSMSGMHMTMPMDDKTVPEAH